MRHGLLILIAAALLGSGCRGGDGGVGDGGGDAPSDVRAQLDMAPPVDATALDGGMDAARPDGLPFVPTPADVDFTAVHPLPTGEQILFNDWNPSPNAVYSMTPDGNTVTEVFRAHRIWSLGVARARDRIAFSSGYPLEVQDQHYGLTMGDSIQHTFIYEVASQTATVVAYGNLNDECHAFGPGDSALYVCRRADFRVEGTTVYYSTYRLGRIDLPGTEFTYLTPAATLEMALFPQPTADGQTLFFGRIEVSGSTQTRSIMKMTLPAGTPELVLAQASHPVLSPSGARMAYQNWSDQFTLWTANLDGSQATRITDRIRATEPCFSPDGTQVAYLYDGAGGCCVEAVKADGSEASAPRCLRDCAVTGEFITELDWITR